MICNYLQALSTSKREAIASLMAECDEPATFGYVRQEIEWMTLNGITKHGFLQVGVWDGSRLRVYGLNELEDM